jgi:hypothetical protein
MLIIIIIIIALAAAAQLGLAVQQLSGQHWGAAAAPWQA